MAFYGWVKRAFVSAVLGFARSWHQSFGLLAFVAVLVVDLTVVSGVANGGAGESEVRWEVQAGDDSQGCELRLRVLGRRGERLETDFAYRAVIRDGNDRPLDGSGQGVYADGRFFSDKPVQVSGEAGEYTIEISAGPNFIPLKATREIAAGERHIATVTLQEWFSPESWGWFAGDHHVHAQHDRQAEVKTSLDYTSLQARSNGLSFVTEAGSNVDYARLEQLSSDTFQIRVSPEVRPGPYVGHLNLLGLPEPLAEERLTQIQRQPLPVQALRGVLDEVRGVVIHTHPLTPRHQAHWMGATEFLSDMVHGKTAHALDIDSRMTEQLYFAGLNLGNRVAVSSYTDCALGRRNTFSPGDRRVYVRLPEANRSPVSYEAMVREFRAGRSVATGGGPLFATLHIGEAGSGDRVDAADAINKRCRIRVAHLHPLAHVELYCRGERVLAVDGSEWAEVSEQELELPEVLEAGDWLVLRVQDEEGNWAITSPIHATGTSAESLPAAGARAMIVQISNATRFIELRRDFFLHALVSVDPSRSLRRVSLYREDELVREWLPGKGQQIGRAGKLPVTEINGEYENGWVWHPSPFDAQHLQLDWRLTESGAYRLVAERDDGFVWRSATMKFDASEPNSHQFSHVQVQGPDTDLQWWGGSEEMPLAEIREPFEGDHWWYPQRTMFRMEARFGGEFREFGDPRDERLSERFGW